MSELQAVPETRPMVVDSDVEDGMELESAELSPGTRGRQGSLLESKESQGRVGGSISRMNTAGWSGAAGSSRGSLSGLQHGSEKQVFKFSMHEAASQSSRNSRTSATSKGTGSKGTGSKHSGGGRAGARKRRQRIARAKGNKVDMDEWNRHVVIIKDFWDNLFNGVSITGLGTSLLDTVETDDTLEPLFRCISAQCASVCPCFF